MKMRLRVASKLMPCDGISKKFCQIMGFQPKIGGIFAQNAMGYWIMT
jgi:hypothetical protein